MATSLPASPRKRVRQASDHAYYHAHAYQCRAAARARYQRNRARILAQKHAAYLAEHGGLKGRYHVPLDVQKAKKKARGSANYQANRETVLQRTKAYQVTNKERDREKNNLRTRRRTARIAGAPINDLTPAQWQAIKAHYGHRCVYCDRQMQRLTMDHIVPISKGGNHTLSNVAPACQSCNSRKKDGAPLKAVQPLLII